ncbi:hypothetical protein COO91_03424 [Nostoc flagelliforme CCNUN1]|uniref:Uncharacterized protein n=2 Tax=Nostoc flagelliforme TaxID=1306274 RepID=A0A2K8SPU4_9NOSO|nr:hypothetical protein COO91_03424 [Nostoc flagelliforme CCNUN1]
MASKNICCKGGGAGGGGGKGGGGGTKQKTAKKPKTKSANGSVKQRRDAAKASGIKGVAKMNSQKLADLGF